MDSTEGNEWQLVGFGRNIINFVQRYRMAKLQLNERIYFHFITTPHHRYGEVQYTCMQTPLDVNRLIISFHFLCNVDSVIMLLKLTVESGAKEVFFFFANIFFKFIQNVFIFFFLIFIYLRACVRTYKLHLLKENFVERMSLVASCPAWPMFAFFFFVFCSSSCCCCSFSL